MEIKIENKRGRPAGSKNHLPLNNKAENVFNDLFKTFNDDLNRATPGERINATIQLAGILLTTKQIN